MKRQLGVQGGECVPIAGIAGPRMPCATPARPSVPVPIRWLWPTAAMCALLVACGPPDAPVLHVAHQCLRVSGADDARLALAAPAAGLLLVTVEERGLSVSADLDGSAEAS